MKVQVCSQSLEFSSVGLKEIQKHWNPALTETYKVALRLFQTGFSSPIGSGIEIKGKLIIFGYFFFLFTV